MSTATLKKGKKSSTKKKGAVISKTVKSHEKDPFFVKKAKQAEIFLKKHGLPAVFAK